MYTYNSESAWFIKIPTFLMRDLSKLDQVHKWTTTVFGTYYGMLCSYYTLLNGRERVRLSSLRKDVCTRGKTKIFDSLVFDRYLFILEPTEDGKADYWVSSAIDYINLEPKVYQRIMSLISMRSEKDSYIKPGDRGYCSPYDALKSPRKKAEKGAPKQEEQQTAQRTDVATASPQLRRSGTTVLLQYHPRDTSQPLYNNREKEKEKNIVVVNNNSNINDSIMERSLKKFDVAIRDLKEIDPGRDRWASMLCEKTKKADAVKEHWPDFIDAFHDHAVRYCKEEDLNDLNKVKRYLMSIIECDKSRIDLMENFERRRCKPCLSSQTLSPYEFVDEKGNRSANGMPIPKDAPPRPSADSVFDGKAWIVA